MDINAETRKDDQDCATKDASPYNTDQKNIQIEKSYSEQKMRAPKKLEEEDKEGTTDKETEEGSEQSSNKDQDSDVSFQEEADEEIGATENEEDWIAYIKRSTKEAEEHMEKQKIPCWIETQRRLKWRAR